MFRLSVRSARCCKGKHAKQALTLHFNGYTQFFISGCFISFIFAHNTSSSFVKLTAASPGVKTKSNGAFKTSKRKYLFLKTGSSV